MFSDEADARFKTTADEGLHCAAVNLLHLVDVKIKPRSGPVLSVKDGQEVVIHGLNSAEGTNVFLDLRGSPIRRSGYRERWVANRLALDSRKRRVGMEFPAGGAENVFDLDAACGQSVGDQRAVAPPGDGFRAHDHRGVRGGEIDEPGQILVEGRSLHVIRVAPKTGILPAGVDGILAGVPKSAESGQMLIPDSVLLQ